MIEYQRVLGETPSSWSMGIVGLFALYVSLLYGSETKNVGLRRCRARFAVIEDPCLATWETRGGNLPQGGQLEGFCDSVISAVYIDAFSRTCNLCISGVFLGFIQVTPSVYTIDQLPKTFVLSAVAEIDSCQIHLPEYERVKSFLVRIKFLCGMDKETPWRAVYS